MSEASCKHHVVWHENSGTLECELCGLVVIRLNQAQRLAFASGAPDQFNWPTGMGVGKTTAGIVWLARDIGRMRPTCTICLCGSVESARAKVYTAADLLKLMNPTVSGYGARRKLLFPDGSVMCFMASRVNIDEEFRKCWDAVFDDREAR